MINSQIIHLIIIV